MFPIEFRTSSLSAFSEEKNFYPKAKSLRGHFNQTFASPLQAKSERFCWDYWSVPDQYRLLRTPAEQFFKASEYRQFVSHLLSWGRRELGCQMISRPWLSAYIDGSFQNLHSDVPHGPYSFVYSLTDLNKRKFTGGETLMARPKLLRYFSELDPGASHEQKDFLKKIEPRFNQLTVFDPRYPHGVARVDGVTDLLAARIVIHGWFTEPRPMIEGGLTVKKAMRGLDEVAEILLQQFERLPYSGLFSVRLRISEKGAIVRAEILASHLITALGEVISKKTLKFILSHLSEFRFPVAQRETEITLPLMLAPL